MSHEVVMTTLSEIEHRVNLQHTRDEEKERKTCYSMSCSHFSILIRSDFNAGYWTALATVAAMLEEVVMNTLSTFEHRVHLQLANPFDARRSVLSFSFPVDSRWDIDLKPLVLLWQQLIWYTCKGIGQSSILEKKIVFLLSLFFSLPLSLSLSHSNQYPAHSFQF